jgi:hypothetical protein
MSKIVRIVSFIAIALVMVAFGASSKVEASGYANQSFLSAEYLYDRDRDLGKLCSKYSCKATAHELLDCGNLRVRCQQKIYNAPRGMDDYNNRASAAGCYAEATNIIKIYTDEHGLNGRECIYGKCYDNAVENFCSHDNPQYTSDQFYFYTLTRVPDLEEIVNGTKEPARGGVCHANNYPGCFNINTNIIR